MSFCSRIHANAAISVHHAIKSGWWNSGSGSVKKSLRPFLTVILSSIFFEEGAYTKILRRYFLYDRKLLSNLSRCGWEALKAFYTTGVRDSKAVPGAVVAIQTFGDFPQGFHPHLHILISDGCFHGNGMFSVSPTADTKALEQIFRHKVLKMLLAKAKITQDMIMLLDKWRHILLFRYRG
jgi:hypothetical protein